MLAGVAGLACGNFYRGASMAVSALVLSLHRKEELGFKPAYQSPHLPDASFMLRLCNQ